MDLEPVEKKRECIDKLRSGMDDFEIDQQSLGEHLLQRQSE